MKEGRPKIEINWDEVNKYLVAGCSGVQVASNIGIHEDTLYRRCQQIYGKGFTAYAAEKRQKGNSMLHAKQFQVAMGGNVSMLVWLGKQRLGQEENPKSQEDFNGSLRELLDELKNLKKEGGKDGHAKDAKRNTN